MENTPRLTDAEMQELESLIKDKLESIVFNPISKDQDNNLIVENQEIEAPLKLFYPGRYSKDENGNIKLSLSIFQVLQSRYFRNNQSVQINLLK